MVGLVMPKVTIFKKGERQCEVEKRDIEVIGEKQCEVEKSYFYYYYFIFAVYSKTGHAQSYCFKRKDNVF